MVSAVDLFTAVSGLPRANVEELVAAAKENQEKLAGCPGPHAFVVRGEAKLGAKYACATCGGEVDASARVWYDRGLLHGRRA